MDDPNGARHSDLLRHAECMSFDDTKPFLERTKGRNACRGESWPEGGVGGECVSVGRNGMLCPSRGLHTDRLLLFSRTFSRGVAQTHRHVTCHFVSCLVGVSLSLVTS